MFLRTMSSSRLPSSSMEEDSESWATGAAIIVRGVLNSWEMFAKKLMFISFILFSCSLSIEAFSLACFSRLRRRL